MFIMDRCADCGKLKQKQFKRCFSCNSKNLDKCPYCKRWKKKHFERCSKCKVKTEDLKFSQEIKDVTYENVTRESIASSLQPESISSSLQPESEPPTLLPIPTQLATDYRKQSDAYNMFMDDYFYPDEGGSIKLNDSYGIFKDWYGNEFNDRVPPRRKYKAHIEQKLNQQYGRGNMSGWFGYSLKRHAPDALNPPPPSK